MYTLNYCCKRICCSPGGGDGSPRASVYYFFSVTTPGSDLFSLSPPHHHLKKTYGSRRLVLDSLENLIGGTCIHTCICCYTGADDLGLCLHVFTVSSRRIDQERKGLCRGPKPNG